MKVEVARITEDIKVFEEAIAAESWDLSSPDIRFINTIKLQAEFKCIGSQILVEGKVDSIKDVRCSRCLETSQVNETFTCALSYDEKTLGAFLTIDDDVREEILLCWPMKPLCKDTCQGICPQCGVNRNHNQCSCANM